MNAVSDYLRMSVKARAHFERTGNLGVPEGFAYTCIEDYVLKNGVVMESAELTRDELEYLDATITRAHELGQQVTEFKQCFANSQMLVLCQPGYELIYHEGYALGRACIPVHHGWVTINGKIVDPTWKLERPASRSVLPEHPIGEIPEGHIYVGAPIENVEYIRHRINFREIIGSLLDDWEGDYPLMRGVDPNDDESVQEFYAELEEAS